MQKRAAALARARKARPLRNESPTDAVTTRFHQARPRHAISRFERRPRTGHCRLPPTELVPEPVIDGSRSPSRPLPRALTWTVLSNEEPEPPTHISVDQQSTPLAQAPVADGAGRRRVARLATLVLGPGPRTPSTTVSSRASSPLVPGPVADGAATGASPRSSTLSPRVPSHLSEGPSRPRNGTARSGIGG